jgi:hypothetical protein
MKDDFNKYKIRVTANDVMRISNLLNEHVDIESLTIGDVMDLNMLVVQLEDILVNEKKLLEAKIIEVSP